MSNDTDDVFDRAADAIWVCSWPAAALWGLSIIGFQIYHWLRYGSWQEIPVATAFHYFGFQLTAVYEPKSWIGVARITEWFLSWPLSLAGALLVLWVAWMIRNAVRGQ